MYNIKEILRIIRTNRERRERRLILERDRRDQQALKLISRYKDLYDLLGDAVYLGQVRGLEGAFRYVLEVRKADYLSEKISWSEKRELFYLACRQRA